MVQLAIILPLISLAIERLLELFDALVMLNLFPWWRSAPVPPPTMLLQEPFQGAWHEDKVIYTVGSSKLELNIHTYDEAKFYYEKEEEIHQQRLISYIKKYGYFFRKSKKGLWRWLFNLVSIKMGLWRLPFSLRLVHCAPNEDYPYSYLENRLARREGVSYKNKDVALAKCIQYIDIDQLLEKANLTQELELLADYCYLRNQRTYEAFSFLKRQIYFVFGIVLGIGIAHLLDIAGAFLTLASSSAQTPTLGGARGLLNGIRVSVASFVSPSPGWNWINAGVGVAMGAGSQPAHGVTNWVNSLSLRRQPWSPGPEPITSREIGR